MPFQVHSNSVNMDTEGSVPESRNFLLMESRICENFARRIRNLEKNGLVEYGILGFGNPEFTESVKILLVESGIWRKMDLWNTESWALEIRNTAQRIRNPNKD